MITISATTDFEAVIVKANKTIKAYCRLPVLVKRQVALFYELGRVE